MTTLKLGIAGLGNVGVGLIERLVEQEKLRLGGVVEIAGISARNRSRKRPVPIDPYPWFDDPVALAKDDNVDVFVELIGGSDGPAKLAVEAALSLGKPVVTANKALIAEYGEQLAKLAEENSAPLLFEAAVAGGIPIVRAVRESLAGAEIKSVRGILNGTCNYLLTEMLNTGAPYADVLSDAQKLGYAEADPFLDVSGTDAAHKIAILATIAFGVPLDFSKISLSGVDTIQLKDLQFAKKLDHKIKLIAEGVNTENGVICRVEPVLLPMKSPLAQIDGPLNAVMVETVHAGPMTFTGPGAGAGPTASAVLGDISALIAGDNRKVLGHDVGSLNTTLCAPEDVSKSESKYLIRVDLADRAGALASLTDALAVSDVSVDELLQDSAGDQEYAPIAIKTHKCTYAAVHDAKKRIDSLPAVVDPARTIRIEAG
ncbi:homoserine dehydrogenase [Ponticaulis profundi]|uniref:Homoserine dehydrogenase n=1 Tax=Ponticaulis profundi TaxID=2665222 RepID=A0ABW1SDY4_9PROT